MSTFSIHSLNCLMNARENIQLAKYSDAKTARAGMMIELKRLLEANPHFHDKLQFPDLNSSRLRTLINQRYMFRKFLNAVFHFSILITTVLLWMQFKLAASALQKS